MSLVIFILILHISEGTVPVLFANKTTHITCPDQSDCRVICTARDSCSNIDIICDNNDFGCYIHCSVNACANSRFYFINSRKSDIKCHANSCNNVEIYIEPKNNNSTVFIDMQSSQSAANININYKPTNNNPYINTQILYNNLNMSNISIPIHPITILCHTNSCRDTYFQISALQYFKLYCLSDNSCNNIDIDFISYNSDNRGELNIDCYGNSSCLNANINAITANKLEMFCHKDINSCSDVLIQCPVNSDVTLTEHSCIMDCEHSNSCMHSMIYSLYGRIQLNNVNINKLNVTNLQMHCGYNFNKTCVMGEDCDSICAIPSQQNNMQMILPFNDNMSLLQCDISTDICIIYMNLNIAQSIQCNNSNQCMVVCMGINCGGTNTINTNIDGSNSNILHLQSSIDSNFAFTNIYGPINGKFISNAALIGLTLYVTDSTEIKLVCSIGQYCDSISIFANNSNNISIECNDITTCKSILTYLTTASNMIPYCRRIHWDCNYIGCELDTNKLYINNELKCDINTHNDKTYCNADYLSEQCDINPLTTVNTGISSTKTVLITTLFNNNINDNVNNNGNGSIWAEVGGILALCILVICFCLCVGGLIIAKNNIKKKLSLHSHTNEVVNDNSEFKNRKRSREDTIGSTVDDIINDSTAIKFKNPLENCEMEMSPIPSHIHHKNTHSISQPPGPNINNIQIHKPNMNKQISPISDDEYKDEEKQIEFHGNNGSNNYLYSRQRGRNTIEGSMDMDDRMHSDELSNINISQNNTNSSRINSHASSLNIHSDKQRTFSNPSSNLIVLSSYNEKDGNNNNINNNEESEDSDELYDSVSSQRDEGGKNTTTINNNNNNNIESNGKHKQTKQIQIYTSNENEELVYAE